MSRRSIVLVVVLVPVVPAIWVGRVLGMPAPVPGASARPPGPPQAPTPSVDCAQINDERAAPSPDLRVLFDRVAVAPQDYWGQQPVPSAPLGYWAKAPVLVKSGDQPVSITVPPEWQKRAAITWGDSGIVRALRISGCASPARTWFFYAGGFYLTHPACVPLTIRVGDKAATVRFAIGRTCSTAD